MLDTNVLSALMRDAPEPQVSAWLDRQPGESVWITTITLFEVRYGLAILTPGRRQQRLETLFDELLAQDLEGRVLDFDRPAAQAAAELAAQRRGAGIVVDIRDTLIAGIVLSRRATLATRNIRHFSDIDAQIVNPWAE